MTTRVRWLWSRTTAPWDDAVLETARALVPAPIREHMPNYRRWQDLQMSLLGKLLLRQLVDPEALAAMTWSDAGRPQLPIGGDFNISHSAGVVACAFCEDGRIGIDLERVRPTSVADFHGVFHEHERQRIASCPDAAAEFYRIWTFKEAVVKADGRGIGIDLPSIDSTVDTVELEPRSVHRVGNLIAVEPAEVGDDGSRDDPVDV